MMATAISGLSRTIVWTKSRSLRVCIGSSSNTISSRSFFAAAACPGLAAPEPEPEGAGTVIDASGEDSIEPDREVVVDRNIQRAQIANSPSPTAPPHCPKSDVTVFHEEGTLAGGAS